jgi:Zn-dependent protease
MNQPVRGVRFTRVEGVQISIGVAVMTFAFAIAYVGGALNLGIYFRLGGGFLILLVLTGSFVAVVTAFFLHELAHKAVAQRYGALAEYRYFPAGLLLGLVTALLGWMLAVPGAVVISGRITPRHQVRISLAGPATNLAFAAVFIGLSIALGTTPGRFREPVPIFIGTLAFVNLLLAGFNLIPVPRIAVHGKIAGRRPLNVTLPASDGFLILAPSKAVWVTSVVALVALGIGGHMLAVF